MVVTTRSKCGSNSSTANNNTKTSTKKNHNTTLYLDQATSSCSSSSVSGSDLDGEDNDSSSFDSCEEESDLETVLSDPETEETVDDDDEDSDSSFKPDEEENDDAGKGLGCEGDEEDGEDVSSQTESSIHSDEEDFMIELPKKIMEDEDLKKIYEKVRNHILTKRTPDLCKILNSKIKFQQKVDLFELYILYANSEPCTEEQLGYREALVKLLPIYSKEYKHNIKYKDALKSMEKRINILDDVSLWPSKIVSLPTSESNKESIFKKFIELKGMSREDEEYGRLERWMKVALGLPYNTLTEGSLPVTIPDTLPHPDNTPSTAHLTDYLTGVKKKLDERLYGMTDVKEQILLFLHIKLRNPSLQGCCLGLIGVPGCGKTTIARCLSEIMQYPFEQISFGGINNSEFLKGYHYTYVGSRPGEIVNCMMRMKTSNGILFFDEYDKVTQNPDIISTLLHITDFSQNSSFRDNYLCDLEVDLSRLWFIYSMNELPENSALRDRIFPIFIEGYGSKDKVRIIVDYLFPKHLENVGLQKTDVFVSDEVATHIIYKSQIDVNDKGIRTIEKAVKDIANKISFVLVHQYNASEFSKFSFFSFASAHERLALPFKLTCDHVNSFLSKFKSHIKDTHVHNMYL
jgi:ATP-dependent Lon protease